MFSTIAFTTQDAEGSVVVKYVDEDGNPISGAETSNQTQVTDTETTKLVDDTGKPVSYDTTDHKPELITAANGTKYTYVKVDTNYAAEIGNLIKGETTVVYVYHKVAESETTTTTTGTVTVHYTDENGNVIQDPVADTTNGLVSTTVTKTEDGKVVSEVTTPSGATYDTTDHKPETITTKDGKEYALVPEKTIGNETGKVTEGNTDVTYVYKEVVTKHVDKNGDPIPDNSTPDDPNDTIPNEPGTKPFKDIPGYESDPSDPKNTEDPKGETVRVYTKVEGSVVVNYVNESGETIQASVTDTATRHIVDENGNPVSYDTTDHKPTTITTKDGKVYEYVKVQEGSANETGDLVKGETRVTYVYKEVVTPTPNQGTPTQPTPTISQNSETPIKSTPVTPATEAPVAKAAIASSGLPQTGDSEEGVVPILAGALMSLLSLVGIKHRRKED